MKMYRQKFVKGKLVKDIGSKLFSKTYSKAKEKMYKSLGLGDDYKKAKVADKKPKSFMDISESAESILEKKAKKKLGIKSKDVFSLRDEMRKKFGLKGDARPNKDKTFRGKKVPGKTYEDRMRNINKIMQKDKTKPPKGSIVRIKKMGGGMMNRKMYSKGSDFGMLSVKAGIDQNPNPTQADRIAGAKMKNKKKK
tara:strand:+ start:78 stop:662 length:585 start_codon:yes stop_codon:yes gene_type:complete